MEAQNVLETAMYYERRQVWLKATKNYEKVFRLIPHIKATSHVNTTRLKLLVYECHYHCGVAYQRMRDYRKASAHFRKAMHVISARKDACSAGCITGRVLHLHVPVLVRISMCHVYVGAMREALKTIEEAVVLDFNNPDLFCARALVYFLLDNKKKATADATFAIKLNSCLVLAWLLRGLFQKLQETSFRLDGREANINRDLVKACDIDANAMVFLHIKNLQDHFQSLFDRFLPSIRMSHTLLVKDVFDGDIRDVTSTRLSGRRLLSCKDLNMKLDSRLEERKRESAVISEAVMRRAQSAPDQVLFRHRTITRKADSSVSRLTSGDIVSTAQAQWDRSLALKFVPHSQVTLGDLLKATHTRSYRLENFQCPANGLDGGNDSLTGNDGISAGERMYPKNLDMTSLIGGGNKTEFQLPSLISKAVANYPSCLSLGVWLSASATPPPSPSPW